MKILNLVLFTIVTCLFTIAAFAADAPTLDGAVLGLVSAVKVGTVGAILLAVGQLLKTQFIGNLIGQINTKVMPYITLVIGIIISVGESLNAGKPWYIGVIEGAIAAFASNKVFDNYALKSA